MSECLILKISCQFTEFVWCILSTYKTLLHLYYYINVTFKLIYFSHHFIFCVIWKVLHFLKLILTMKIPISLLIILIFCIELRFGKKFSMIFFILFANKLLFGIICLNIIICEKENCNFIRRDFFIKFFLIENRFYVHDLFIEKLY